VSCYVVASDSNHLYQCHGSRKSVLGISVHACPITARVCVDCGHILLFADSPGVFRPELPGEHHGGAVFPVPAETPPLSEGTLPIPSASTDSGD